MLTSRFSQAIYHRRETRWFRSASAQCAIFFLMEVARELDETTHSYHEVRLSRRFLGVAAGIVLLAAVFGGTIGNSRKLGGLTNPAKVNSYRVVDDIEKDYNEAVSTITGNYSGDIDYEKATQAAIQGMLSTLDPHSAYFPYTEFKKLKEDQDSRFYGIGVTIVQHRDGVYIQSAVDA